MSQRRLRDELRDVFDTMSEPAHPALGARIRAELRSAPASGMRAPRLAAAVAVLVAVLIVASLVFVSRHGVLPPGTPAHPGAPTASPSPSATPVPAGPGPTASPSATPTSVPTGSPSSPAAGLPPFVCGTQSGTGPTSPPTGITDVRAGAQSGYDRFVIQFDGAVPAYDVVPQSSATFFLDPSGQRVTLAGSAGLVVTVHGARSAGSYTGSTDQKPSGTAVLKEARQTGDFEGVVHWGLGLSHASCFRAFTLTGPSRLVVDVQG
jgi:hypothetical protein